MNCHHGGVGRNIDDDHPVEVDDHDDDHDVDDDDDGDVIIWGGDTNLLTYPLSKAASHIRTSMKYVSSAAPLSTTYYNNDVNVVPGSLL